MNKRKSQLFENENRTGRNASGVTIARKFRSCGYGLFVTKKGVVANKLGKIMHQQKTKSAWRISILYENKWYYPTVASLVARAWCPDWYEGCGVIRKDGDMYNHNVDNLQVCTPQEFRRFKSRLTHIRKAKDRGGDFRDCGIDKIECTTDGVFRREGIYYKPHYKVVNGKKTTCSIAIRVESGVTKYYNCADLVCRAWRKNKYEEGCRIIYKDGDIHNVRLDNLEIVRYDQYVEWLNRRHSKAETPTVEEELARMDEITQCCQMSKRFIATGDYREWNKYVQDVLYPYIVLSCEQKELGVARTRYIMSELVGTVYELIGRRRGMYDPKAFVEKHIREFSRYGKMYIPVLPNKAVEEAKKLDLSGLEEKYKLYRKTTRYGRPI